LTIQISYQHYFTVPKYESLDTSETEAPHQDITVCRNINTGKYFIFKGDTDDNILVNPEGMFVDFKTALFEEPKEERLDYLRDRGLITEKQLTKYQKSQQEDDDDDILPDEAPRRRRITRPRPTNHRTNGGRSPSPPVSDWLRGVPELLRVPELNNWAAICRYLRVSVDGDSARRRLAEYVRDKRPDWPKVPEP